MGMLSAARSIRLARLDNIRTVDQNISDASETARELLSASHDLNGEFRALETQVQAFVATVRSGR